MTLRALILAAPLLCAACGSYTLGYVQPQPGTTAQQQQLDTLSCKDEAKLAASSAGQTAAQFMLGLTIIGYPAGVEMERSTQRQTFTDCMTQRGYAVRPAR